MNETTLWSPRPAENWNEAYPLGSGRLGMMVFGGVKKERIQLNEETFWSGWEYPEFDSPETKEHLGEMRELIFAGKYTEAQRLCNRYMVCRGQGHHDVKGAYGSYQTAGDLYLIYDPAADKAEAAEEIPADYRRELRLDEGLAEVRFCGIRREYFVSKAENAAVIRVTGLSAAPGVRYERENCSIIHDRTENGGEISAVGFLPLKFAVRIQYAFRDGVLTVFIAAATAFLSDRDPDEICRGILDSAGAAGADALREGNRAYFSSMLGRALISLAGAGEKADIPTAQRLADPENDPGLAELYYNFGRYLLICSSGPESKLPANLQGIWCEDYLAPWSADYHININIQMNYWFAEAADLPELTAPFFAFLMRLAKYGEKTARVAYGCPGWVAHAITNPWGYTSLGCNPVYGAFAAAGAWCLRHVKERWLYGGDREFLAQFWPVTRGACEFFLAYLVRDPRTGTLVTCPASSPENSFLSPTDGSPANVCAGPTMDMSILRELFSFALDAARELGTDAEFSEKVEAALADLPPLRIGKHGGIMEWSEDFDEAEPGHRHMSHLYGLYPAAEITRSTPELFEAARKTIARRLSHGGGHTGWSRAWIVNFFARLGDGEAAHENLTALLKKSTLPNLFDNHPPFQIDGNFGGTAGMIEMLLQSHDGAIELLPALPSAWADGEFRGFKARGGFTVSAAWKAGKVVRCSVTGGDGKPFAVRFDGKTYEGAGEFRYGAE